MEGLLSTGPTPSSFETITQLARAMAVLKQYKVRGPKPGGTATTWVSFIETLTNFWVYFMYLFLFKKFLFQQKVEKGLFSGIYFCHWNIYKKRTKLPGCFS